VTPLRSLGPIVSDIDSLREGLGMTECGGRQSVEWGSQSVEWNHKVCEVQ
jgi:hypothetical protein